MSLRGIRSFLNVRSSRRPGNLRVVCRALLAALLAGGIAETAGVAHATGTADGKGPAAAAGQAAASPGTAATAVPGAVATPEPAATERAKIAALIQAATEDDPRRIESLVRAGAPVNGRNPRGEHPLQAAAAEGRNSNVFLLLTLGAEIDAFGARGTTALGWAARNGHEPVVRTLLDAGASPDAAADAGHAPLALAVTRENSSIAWLLIERGSKVFEKPELAAAVLIALSEANRVDVSEILVPKMAGLVASSHVARKAAADAIVNSNEQFSKAIRQQLGPAIQTPEFQTVLLLSATRRSRHDLASEAIKAGADVNATHPPMGTPLSVAMSLGDGGMVNLLLAAHADWKAAGIEEHRLRAFASDADNDRLAASLAESIGVSDLRDEHGETLMFRAAQRGDFLAVKRLLTRNADPSATVKRWAGDRGWTALMTAAAQGQPAIVELLVRGGAPVNQKNAAGRTALSFAAFYGRSSVVAALLAAGADPDVADVYGQTPMVLAEASGDLATQQMIRMATHNAGTAASGAAPTASSAASSTAAPGSAGSPGAAASPRSPASTGAAASPPAGTAGAR